FIQSPAVWLAMPALAPLPTRCIVPSALRSVSVQSHRSARDCSASRGWPAAPVAPTPRRDWVMLSVYRDQYDFISSTALDAPGHAPLSSPSVSGASGR